jgi:hypothetical protein
MKISNEDVIKSGEQDLIDGISADLDWDAIERIFAEQHRLAVGEDVEYRSGDLVVYDNQVAYKLEFDVKIPFTVLLDRLGNHLAVFSTSDMGHGHEDLPDQNTTRETDEETPDTSFPDDLEKIGLPPEAEEFQEGPGKDGTEEGGLSDWIPEPDTDDNRLTEEPLSLAADDTK